MDVRYIIKNIWQCFLVLIEFAGVSVLFVVITAQFVKCDNFIQYMERGTLGLAIYEFIIFISLNFVVDAEKDSLNGLISLYKLAILSCEENSKEIKKEVSQLISKEIEKGMMNSSKFIAEYKILEKLMYDNRVTELKYLLINNENMFEACDLKWRYSLLLKKFK